MGPQSPMRNPISPGSVGLLPPQALDPDSLSKISPGISGKDLFYQTVWEMDLGDSMTADGSLGAVEGRNSIVKCF